MARELSSRNITCNVVTPGFVDTDMTASLPDERKAAILAQVPLGRLASAGEVAFLARDDAAYITGADTPATTWCRKGVVRGVIRMRPARPVSEPSTDLQGCATPGRTLTMVQLPGDR